MIILTKLNQVQIAVNSDLIQYIEETPDTVITMANDDKVVVTERISEIIEKVVTFRRYINNLIETEYERQHRTAK
jgi:flagellar protein FlbD